jgi:protein TonB
MFETIADTRPRGGRRRTTPLTLSLVVHLAVLGAIALPALLLVGELPQMPTMLAFVADVPAAPPPPPPPPPPAARAETRARSEASPTAAPIEAPAAIAPESQFEATDAGVIGGVEGGIPGGILGGMELEPIVAPPAPPPPPPPPRTPVRIGGEIAQPALLIRVPPVYPEIAMRAQVQGLVILEAVVDEEGTVGAIKVLRSVKFLDEPAIEAVKQWRYSPLLLNGTPVPFVLTVTVSFKVETAAR